MKTAISIPDDVYESAEELAARLGTSRSELYTKAVRRYVARHKSTGVTEKLNEIYGSEDSKLDPVIMRMQSGSLPKEKW